LCEGEFSDGADFAINNLHDLHEDRLRQLDRQIIHKNADRWQKALPVGNKSRERGIASKPSWQHLPQGSRSNVFAADVAGQRDNAEAGDRRLFQGYHVVTQEPGRQGYDQFILRFARMTKAPNGRDPRAHHEQRSAFLKILGRLRRVLGIEVC
jgi:hypothetical protein